MIKKTELAKDKSLSCIGCQNYNKKIHICKLDGQQICWLTEEQVTCKAWIRKPYGEE